MPRSIFSPEQQLNLQHYFNEYQFQRIGDTALKFETNQSYQPPYGPPYAPKSLRVPSLSMNKISGLPASIHTEPCDG